jgi:hypothetical protein
MCFKSSIYAGFAVVQQPLSITKLTGHMEYDIFILLLLKHF